MKKRMPILQLNRETVRQLTTCELRDARGAIIIFTEECPSHFDNCPPDVPCPSSPDAGC